MTTPISVLGDGNVKVSWVTAIANTTAPTAAELNAASSVDLSCYLTADGLTTGTDEQAVTDDRLCSTQTFEKPGRFSDTLELMYVYQPQLPSAADNKAFFTLVHLTTGFIVIRWGKAYAGAFTASVTTPAAPADQVNVEPATCGVQREQPPEANSVLKIAQKIWISGQVRRNVAVV